MKQIKTTVKWRLNKSFRIQQTFPSFTKACVYATYIRRTWFAWNSKVVHYTCNGKRYIAVGSKDQFK